MTSIPQRCYSKLSGVVFRQLQKKQPLIVRHWLDTETDKYYETTNQIVIPEFCEIPKRIPAYGKRAKDFINHVNPSFDDSWSFGVELAYKKVADKSHQTEENLVKMRILRSIIELLYDMTAVLDDCSDHSILRLDKKTWHTICKGGIGTAIYEAAQLGYFPFILLTKHFKNHPNYENMMEIYSSITLEMLIGQSIDVIGFDTDGSMEKYMDIVHYKAGQLISLPCGLGLLHAGLSGEIVHQAMTIWSKMGCIVQVWDDFNDYYCSPEETGKPPCDFQNGGTTWVSCTAMANFNHSQLKEFKECYGSSDSEKIKRARKLYDDINMPHLYVEYMTDQYYKIKEDIDNLQHPKVRDALMSYLEWLLGNTVTKRI